MKKETMLYPEIYSNGTLRSVDLLEAILTALSPLHLSKSERKIVNEGMRCYNYLLKHSNEDKFYKKFCFYPDDMYDDLIYIADAHCAEYCYWGSSEGDGACIGVWVSIERVEEDIRYEELPKIEDIEKGYSGLAFDTSDHGNVTLYQVMRGKAKEIWAIG